MWSSFSAFSIFSIIIVPRKKTVVMDERGKATDVSLRWVRWWVDWQHHNHGSRAMPWEVDLKNISGTNFGDFCSIAISQDVRRQPWVDKMYWWDDRRLFCKPPKDITTYHWKLFTLLSSSTSPKYLANSPRFLDVKCQQNLHSMTAPCNDVDSTHHPIRN